MKLLLLLLLLPVCLSAQEVSPIISKDYLSLIGKDSLAAKNGFAPDTMNSMRAPSLKLVSFFDSYPIRRISTGGGRLRIQPLVPRLLLLSGNFTSTVELKRHNQTPGLQSTYAQGRSGNGSLVWRGPETGELFSYGPALNTLEFDGGSYPYDVNGKLVARGAGNGHPANAYDNTIFRTAALAAQSFNIQGRYFVSGKQRLLGSIKLGQTSENTVISDNKNSGQNLLASLEASPGKFSITGSYNYIQQRFSNSNRNGFLNRVYQNTLLSPVSFDNAQGSLLGAAQRSYSNAADNPLFLLSDNGNSFFQTHQAGSLAIGRNSGFFRFSIMQSLESLQQNSREGYKPATAGFPNGIATDRQKNDANYFLKANASIGNINYNNYELRSTADINYIFADNHAAVDYRPGMAHHYQRSSHDLALNYTTWYSKRYLDAGLGLTNKFYFSNTASSAAFFLPSASGFIKWYDILSDNSLTAKLSASVSSFNSELPIDRSFSSTGLLQYSTQQAFQYFPVGEATGFGHLQPIHHTEWMAALDLYSSYKISFRAEVFRQTILHDVFPVFDNGSIDLRNMVNHRNNGIELEAMFISNIKKARMTNTISFYANQDKVTGIDNGSDYTPIAGFSDVYKALVKGEAPGVIVGSSYLRDASKNIIIGSDGFPLVSPNASVLGNPLPRFVMKMDHSINWKQFSFLLDWEWKKGGSVWNGTQAALDYYGRSETSARLRNTTGYVFAGVLQNGHPNTIPVSFYDPAMPVENNRWTRYGYSGVAESYIQKADHIRINNINLSYKVATRKYIRHIVFSLYASNILIWTAYKGADPNQLLYDQPGTGGLDFFNLPSTKTVGFNVSVQF